MKILYVHQYFRTPQQGGCTRSYDLARGLAGNGHEIEMITAHNGKRQVVKIDGINVHYLPVKYANHFGFIRRIYAFLKFVYLAKKEARLIGKSDLAYVMTTPLTTGLIALFLKDQLNIPYYFEVGDLWPSAPVQMGVIRQPFLRRKLFELERKCYFEADKVIALSPAIRNYVDSVSPRTRINVLPNFFDCNSVQSDFRIKRFTAEFPLQVGYIGTFGKANHLDFLLQAAKICEAQDLPVRFNLMGDGAELKKIRDAAKKLSNVSFYPFGSKRKAMGLLENQDAVYISFKDVEILNTGSPNKFFEGLGAGKLIIINFGGWIRSLIEDNKCGFYHDPRSPEEFARKINVFLHNPKLLLDYQKRARKLAESYYDKDLQVRKLLKILNNEKKLNISDSEVCILTA